MFKISLYHKLGEICIDTIFYQIKKNFSAPKPMQIGSKYDRITIVRSTHTGLSHMETFTNCIITHVYEGKYGGNPVTLFNFKTPDGDMLMGCELFGSILE
jgi:hypothetical protein